VEKKGGLGATAPCHDEPKQGRVILGNQQTRERKYDLPGRRNKKHEKKSDYQKKRKTEP